MTPDEARTQVVRLKALEAARTNANADGGAKPGYRRNVEMLRREIRRLENSFPPAEPEAGA